MGTFVKEIEEELTQKLIPFWENLRDEEYGGFYGYMGYDLKVQKDYEKGCILNSRILWFFANAYMTLGEEKLKEDADHAYAFLKRNVWTENMAVCSGQSLMTGNRQIQRSIPIIRHSQFMLSLPIMMQQETRKHWRLPEAFRK